MWIASRTDSVLIGCEEGRHHEAEWTNDMIHHVLTNNGLMIDYYLLDKDGTYAVEKCLSKSRVFYNRNFIEPEKRPKPTTDKGRIDASDYHKENYLKSELIEDQFSDIVSGIELLFDDLEPEIDEVEKFMDDILIIVNDAHKNAKINRDTNKKLSEEAEKDYYDNLIEQCCVCGMDTPFNDLIECSYCGNDYCGEECGYVNDFGDTCCVHCDEEIDYDDFDDEDEKE